MSTLMGHVRAISVPDMDGVPPEGSEMSVGRKGNITDAFSYRRLSFFFLRPRICATTRPDLENTIWMNDSELQNRIVFTRSLLKFSSFGFENGRTPISDGSGCTNFWKLVHFEI